MGGMDEKDFLYIAETIGLLVPIRLGSGTMYLISPHATAEDIIIFAEALTYEVNRHRDIAEVLELSDVIGGKADDAG